MKIQNRKTVQIHTQANTNKKIQASHELNNVNAKRGCTKCTISKRYKYLNYTSG